MNDHLLIIESIKCLQIVSRLEETANGFTDSIRNRIKDICVDIKVLFEQDNSTEALLNLNEIKTETGSLRRHLFNLAKENNLKVHFFDEVDQLLLRLSIELNKIHKQLK